jgi:hypothetical protein
MDYKFKASLRYIQRPCLRKERGEGGKEEGRAKHFLNISQEFFF